MAWFGDTFGDGLSSLKGQLTKITKDVLSEDPLAVTSFEGKIKDLEEQVQKLCTQLKNQELLEKNLLDLEEEKDALTKAVDSLEAEHEKALQIVIEERDTLRRSLNNKAHLDSEMLKTNLEQRGDDTKSVQMIMELEDQLRQKQADITCSLQENGKLQQQLAAITSELASDREILNDFNDRLQKSEEETSNLNEKLEITQKDNNTLKRKLKVMKESVRSSRDVQSQLDSANSQIATLVEESKNSRALQEEVESLKEQLNNTQAELMSKVKELQSLKQDIVQLQNDLQTTETELDATQNRLRDKEEATLASSTEIKAKIEEIELEAVMSKREFDNLKQSMDDAKSEYDKKIKGIEVEKNELNLELETVNDKLNEAEAHAENLKNENDKLLEKMTAYEKKSLEFEDMEMRFNDSKQQYNKLIADYERLQKIHIETENDAKINIPTSFDVQCKDRQLTSKVDHDETNKRIKELEDEILEKDRAWEKVQAVLEDIKANHKTTLEEVALLSQRSENLEREKSELKEKYAAAAEALQNIREQFVAADISSIMAAISAEKEQFKNAERNLEAAQKEIQLLNETLQQTQISQSLSSDKLAKINEELLKEQRVKMTLLGDLDEVKARHDEASRNLDSLLREKDELQQKLTSIDAENDSELSLLRKEVLGLKLSNAQLEGCESQLTALKIENKALREKVDNVGFGVIAADFDAQLKKLQQLAKKMHPTVSVPDVMGDSDFSTERVKGESKTDDVKRLQQDLSAMTASINQIELGVNTLEDNINKWAAALAARDQVIQTQQTKIAEMGETNVTLEKKLDGINTEKDEWEKRVRELQTLYESEVNRLETLCHEKDTHIDQLSRHSAEDSNEGSQNSTDDAAHRNDHIKRLVGENADLKELVQQLRSNMLQLNNRASNQLIELPTNTMPQASQSQRSDLQYQALKEKEMNQSKELERLRAHLMEVEEHYTAEAMSTEAELLDLRGKLATMEEQMRSSNNIYKSANVRATQHVDALNTQIQLITVQRNDLQAKLSEAEDQAQKQAAALTSLQLVLEQFQIDKQRELQAIEERHKYQIQLERRQISELEEEVQNGKKQLAEANNGLKAALRLGEQLDKKSRILADCEQELSNARDELQAAKNQLTTINLATASKIDKSLIKNIVLGYLGAQGEHKTQALRVMTAVLELTEEERNRAGLRSSEAGWLAHFLHPSGKDNNSPSSESLSQAFVRFLESESRPQPQLRLLGDAMNGDKQRDSGVKRTPLVLSELVLPSVTPTPVSESALNDVINDS